ncbi:MAG: molybdopterin-dependent oxidoreductase [Actinomycetota bacterium]|nr:molybdopterin-dependent oxidoreductase [Actinomycetota bacterium]
MSPEMSDQRGEAERSISHNDLRLVGALAAALALGVMWLASQVAGVGWPPASVGDAIVRSAPGDLATFFIEALGHWAMRLLVGATVLGTLVVGAELLARTARADRVTAAPAAAVLATLGIAAAVLGPSGGASRFASALVAVLGALTFLTVATAFHRSLVAASETDHGRRRVVRWGTAGLAGLGLTGFIARFFTVVGGPDTDVSLATATDPATIPDRPPWPDIRGLTPEVTSVDDHYVVDINLFAPSVEAEGWVLKVIGAVANPMELTFTDLQQRWPVVEEYSVLTCVSNEVGGDLIGHSLWRGVRLRDVLRDAGVNEGAVDVVFRAADGYSDSISLAAAERSSTLLAVAQNGKPLQQDHGFPCRVRVPSIYGMKNVKWLEEIEVVSSDYAGYWQTRGWSDEAIVKTQSRIDVPTDQVTRGEPAWIAGIAWAGDRGVSRVEVSTDDGRTWAEAMLRPPISKLSWYQWAHRWTPEEEGAATLMSRATDGEGRVQEMRETEPHPAGASGLHRVEIDVV